MELQRNRWSPTLYQTFFEELKSLAEEDYRKFRIKILKAPTPILGIRQPLLKKLSAQILKGNALSFLEIPKGPYFEEQMIHGYVLAKIPLPYQQKKKLIFDFLEAMDNWSICDDFVSALKPFVFKNQVEFLDDISPLAEDSNPWKVRFLLVVLLQCYLGQDSLTNTLSLCHQIHRNEYYIKMAQAWLLSMAYIRNPNEVMETLHFFEQDRFVFLKTISKIIDSYRVETAQKAALKEYREQYKQLHKER